MKTQVDRELDESNAVGFNPEVVGESIVKCRGIKSRSQENLVANRTRTPHDINRKMKKLTAMLL